MNQTPGDRELDEVLDDPGLISLAQGLSRFRPDAVDPDRAFQSELRRRLLAESWHRNQPRRSLWRRAWTMPNLAWAGAALGIILILGVGIEAVINKPFGVQQLTVTSPVSNAQAADLRQAIELNFTRPMDRASVEHALSIAPAVAVSYTWTSPTSLSVVPVYPLAPDTRYQVTVASTAHSSSGQALGGAAKVGFVTTPLPASTTPPPPPSPPPTPAPIKLGSATGLAPLWSQDGKRVYVVGSAGDLESYPAAGGIATQVAPDQVQLVAVGPAGPAFWRAGVLHYASTQMAVANVLAIGFATGQPLVATTADIRTAAGKVLFTLPEAAASAAISSDGTRVAYLNGSGLLRVVDLARATDISLGQADAYAWSPDARHLAFGAPLGVEAADLGGASPTPTGTPSATPAATPPATPAAPPPASTGPSGSVAESGATATVLTHLTGVKSLSWNVASEILASTGEGVFSLKATGVSTPQQILPAAAGAAEWAPAGSDVAYLESSIAYTLSSNAQASLSNPSDQDEVVKGFMDARLAGNAPLASTFLDANGVTAYSGLALLYSAKPSLARYSILLSEPGVDVARLILEQANQDSAVLESMSFIRDLNGKLLVDAATASAPRPLGLSPEVVSVKVLATGVALQFDSTLQASTVASGFSLAGAAVKATYNAGTGTVTLAPTAPLALDHVVDLGVKASLTDIAGHPAAPLQLQILGV